MVQNPVTARIDDHDSDDNDVDEVVVIRERTQRDEVDEAAQSDFDREFAKMLADTTDARRGDRKAAPPIFDTAVPHIRRQAEPALASLGPNGGHAGAGGMQFSLLSKKGNKQQVRLPSSFSAKNGAPLTRY